MWFFEVFNSAYGVDVCLAFWWFCWFGLVNGVWIL